MSEYIIDMGNSSYQSTSGLLCADVSQLRGEIVRCRDCSRFVPQGTYRFNSGTTNKDTCDVIRGFVVQINPDGFCAWGERREK